jgi:hypothetical protein
VTQHVGSAQQPPSATLELYKMGADFADKLSARRNTANGFFLTAETALVTVAAFVLEKQRPEDGVKVAIVAAGVLLSATWWLQLRSYRDLNKAKFTVLTEIEKALPVALFSDEQKILDGGGNGAKGLRGRYAELGATERVVPVLFALIWLSLLLVGLT